MTDGRYWRIFLQMTRTSKQEERRQRFPRKNKHAIYEKTGPKKDNLNLGFKEHANALEKDAAKSAFIPKIK